MYREGNSCTDWVANFALNSDMQHDYLDFPPTDLIPMLLGD